MDLKYDVLKHPNVELSGDGKARPYTHGDDSESIASINLDFNSFTKLDNKEDKEESNFEDYEIITSEEMNNYLRKKGNNESNK